MDMTKTSEPDANQTYRQPWLLALVQVAAEEQL
jgi:hypothetical protein